MKQKSLIDLCPNGVPAWFDINNYQECRNFSHAEWRLNLQRRYSTWIKFEIFNNQLTTHKDTDDGLYQYKLHTIYDINKELEELIKKPCQRLPPNYSTENELSDSSVYFLSLRGAAGIMYNLQEENSLSTTEKEAITNHLKNIDEMDKPYDEYVEHLTEDQENLLDQRYNFGLDEEILVIDTTKPKDQIIKDFKEKIDLHFKKDDKLRQNKIDNPYLANLHKQKTLPILDLMIFEKFFDLLNSKFIFQLEYEILHDHVNGEKKSDPYVINGIIRHILDYENASGQNKIKRHILDEALGRSSEKLKKPAINAMEKYDKIPWIHKKNKKSRKEN